VGGPAGANGSVTTRSPKPAWPGLAALVLGLATHLSFAQPTQGTSEPSATSDSSGAADEVDAASIVAAGADKSVRIRRIATAPVIDGVLDEEVWLRAPVINDLHQVNPVEFAQPSERTEVRLLYDRDALYIGVRLFDSHPELINARVLRQNQPIGSDDRFFVHIDPFNSRRGGYLFGVNPNGVRFDGVFEGVTQRQFDWDGIWQAAATIDDKGWVVEIAIPFKTLSFDPSTDTWRMNFARNIERDNETIAWVSRDRNMDLSTMGEVRGISQIEQGRGLDVVPSASVHDRRAFPNVPGDTGLEPSLEVFYKITPQLNASLTLNTDFSGTEVDDRQVNLTRFSLFFPEKRAFFLQDLDIFQFGRLQQDGRPFFSRRLGINDLGQQVPLDFGGKLSGRIGRIDLGMLAVRQQAFGGVDATTAVVARVAANVLAESSVGMIFTDGDPNSNLGNSVAGIDFRYLNSRFAGGRSMVGEAWVQKSKTEGVVGDDRAAGIGLRVPSNTGINGGITLTRIGSDFNPALGFVRRQGVREAKVELGNTWRPSGGKIRTIGMGLNADHIEYLDNGDVQSESLQFDLLDVNLNSQDSFNLSYNKNREGLRVEFPIWTGITIQPGLYSFDSVRVGVRTGQQRAIGGGFFLDDGQFYDGDRRGASMFFGWRPGKHFRTNINYQVNDITLPGGDFQTRVVKLTFETAFTSTLSWINLIQYDNVSETVGINSRLHWIPQAGREAYLVLNHNVDDLDHDGIYHSSFSELTLKYSYTFRF
jgi:Carbohydrate family 9 binding domain-like/Domain of unknown function (DUF5916)